MIILGLDALDVGMAEKFRCKELMQSEYGRTNLSDFKLERTVVLWSSFLTEKNMENKIPVKGQWKFKLKEKETFFRFFKSFKTIDVPAFSLKQENHRKERKLLAGYFKDENSIEEFDEVVWKNHEENKKDFFDAFGKFDLVMGYFDLADAIGHLSFGDLDKMKIVYDELESIAKQIRKRDDFILIVSDHGMKAVGRFGDHSRTGFYSSNKKLNLQKPKITDFYKIIEETKNA